MTEYAELQVTTNFSFLRGASHPEEMAAEAAALGLAAVAITDRNTLAGVVRAHGEAKAAGIRLIVGARLDFTDAPSVLCLPTDRAAYGRLSRLLTVGKRRAPKGECHIALADLFGHADGQIIIALSPDEADEAVFGDHLTRLGAHFPGRIYLAAQHLYRGNDLKHIARLARLADGQNIPLVATNDVHAHAPDRRRLMDVIACIRDHCTIDSAGFRLAANAERHLKPAGEMARLFRDFPDAVARTVKIAQACNFSLDELAYEYPDNEAPVGTTPQGELERLSWDGTAWRYPDGVTDAVRAQVTHELELIGELGYAPYFLTVHDIVRFARGRGILCQGRGSAANSAVCYCLGITAVDPSRMDLLFERFISAERDEPPDIDVDFEHERREEVIQYIYRKYGRDRAGLTATVIHYRSRMAIREVGKALGLSADAISALAGTVWGWRSDGINEKHIREIGLNPSDTRLGMAIELARELTGFPRHLSQHVGGFVITRGPLSEMVPVANAAMDDRTTIEWDKNDLDALGILKIDVLGLGMLSCIRKAFDLLRDHYGRDLDLATVPAEDPAVYDMLCEADSLGVFQVESRAQMTMLPRLRPRNFYDLVIEVAIVRPGPIQGDMVHPYLRRRRGDEKVDYPSDALRQVLAKTLGIPLFQEQAMKIAIVAAGFTPTEADNLRRAMATFRRAGTIHSFQDKLVRGMVANGYEAGFAERCFKQIEGFGEYGFPESHAASFALLVYVSAWLKCHYPDVFAAAILNSQPMGFYAPAQLVRDAKDHGVETRPVDINHSDWDCTLEAMGEQIDDASELELPLPSRERLGVRGPDAGRRPKNSSGGQRPPHLPPLRGGSPLSREGRGNLNLPRYALRLGLRQIKGFSQIHGDDLIAAREDTGRPFADPADLWRRARLPIGALETLSRADAYGSTGRTRRQALWAVRALGPDELPLFTGLDESSNEPETRLPVMGLGEEVSHDYSALRLSLKKHPLALMRDRLATERVTTAERLSYTKDGARVTVAGLALVRQRPGTASGVIFITLEDETGVANLVVWPKVFERYRREVMGGRLIRVTGQLQREGIVIHVIAQHIEDLTDRLRALAAPHETAAATARPRPEDRRSYPSRDFH
ncbi:MAG: error-prone DNA polymerase [Pseudomonadota bacterium]|nr:error-prone DNA polymerase [Pseudomonadota bacterium]